MPYQGGSSGRSPTSPTSTSEKSSSSRKTTWDHSPRETALGCFGFAIIVALVALCGHALLFSSPSSANQTQPTAAATASTTTRALIRSATLGGTEGDFDTAPTLTPDPAGATWSYTAQIAGVSVLVQPVPSNPAQATDGQARALIINLTPPPDQQGMVNWTPAQAAQIAAVFLPTDATPVRIVSPDANGHTDHILHSAQLAASFVASAFTNDAGTHTVPPGTLFWSCDTPAGTPSCYLAIGTN